MEVRLHYNQRMLFKDPWQERSAKVTTIFFSLLIFAAFIALGLLFKDLVKLFIFGLMINYLLSNPVRLLTKLIRIRALAIFTSFAAIITFFFVIGSSLSPVFTEQSEGLSQSLPYIKTQIHNFLENSSLSAEKLQISREIMDTLDSSEETNLFTDFISLLSNNFGENGFYQIISSSLQTSINVLTGFVLTMIISFYLLLDGERLWNLFVSIFPKKQEKHFAQIKTRIDSNLYGLIVGQFQIALLTAGVMLITYIFLGNQFALLLGSLQMLEFIPILGTWVAIVPSILIVLTTSGTQKAIIAASIYLVYTQIIRDQIIAPRIMSAAFGIHPLMVIFGLLISIQIFGLVGLVVGLPIIAIISAVVDYLILFKDRN